MGNSLIKSAIDGDLQGVKDAIKNGAKIDYRAASDWTPLIAASAKGHLSVVKYLVENRAGINLQSKEGYTPLFLASAYGHLSVVKYLVENRANINLQDKEDNTPLLLASANGHLQVVQYLAEQGADINKRNKNGQTAYTRATAANHNDVVAYLNLYLNCNQNLLIAAQEGNIKGVQDAIKYGADIDYANGYGCYTPLMYASGYGHLSVVKYLVEEHDADINLCDEDGDTALDWAKMNGQTAVAEYLNLRLDSILNSNLYLYTAARNGNLRDVESALKNGANVNSRFSDGSTALSAAAIGGHLPVVKHLVENGANLNARSTDGKAPLDYAYDMGEMDVYDYLLAKGARAFTHQPIVNQPAAPAQVAQAEPVYSYSQTPQAPTQSNNSTPSQTSGQRGAQAVVQGLQQLQDTLRGSLDTGRYKMSGRAEEISFTGMANTGNLYYKDANGKTSTGTYSISGDRITMNILGNTYFYTITSRTSFSGHSQEWFRVGF